MMYVDRVANPVLNGIEGETRAYNGTDYTYYGPSDIVITENEDGTVSIDTTMCNGCGLCKSLCKFDAIETVEK